MSRIHRYATLAAAAICTIATWAEAQVTITRTRTETTYTPINADTWYNTAINAPVTILNANQVGIWQRAVQYRLTQTQTTWVVRFPSYSDYFWGTRGRTISRTTANGPQHNTTEWKTETRGSISSTTPGAALPGAYTRVWYTVFNRSTGVDPTLGGIAHTSFGEAAASLAFPDTDPASDTFESMCGMLSPGFDAAGMTFGATAAEFAGASTSPGDLANEFEMHFAGLAGAFGAIAGELGAAAGGAPLVDPMPFDELAFQLFLIGDLFDAAGFHDFSEARVHLDAAAMAAGEAAMLVSTDLYSTTEPRDPERILFLNALNTLSAHLNDFAVAVDDAQFNACLADVSPTGLCDLGMPDGVVDLSDFSCYLSAWSTGSPFADVTTTGACTPDATDEVVDLSDFSCFLGAWSTGCP